MYHGNKSVRWVVLSSDHLPSTSWFIGLIFDLFVCGCGLVTRRFGKVNIASNKLFRVRDATVGLLLCTMGLNQFDWLFFLVIDDGKSCLVQLHRLLTAN